MNLWQPSIDRWIIKESDSPIPSTTNAPMNGNNSERQSHLFGADLMAGGVPVKSEEEEDVYDKLPTPYKGIKTLTELKKKIHEVLQNIYDLSKTDKFSYKTATNPYELIKGGLNHPDFKGMLDVAEEEIKRRFVST